MNELERKSRLFEGFKSVGFVSTHIPHIVRYIDRLDQIRVITASNNCFLVFNNKLKLIETCVSHSSDINVLTSDSKYVYTSADNEIFGWKYGHKWKWKSFVGCVERVEHILPFGPHLIAIDAQNILRVWEIRTQELTLTLPFNEVSFRMSALLHPITYINKILLASAQGSLQLWNIRTQTLIYTFKGWESRVTQLSQAPAIDVVAIGLENGCIYVHNLRLDETVMRFKQEWGSVQSLTFRSDGQPFMVSSSASGHLAVWNLEQKRLESQMRHIHSGPVVGTSFIDRQSLLVTNSTDNSLKIWSFDESVSTGRILYQREGHIKAPTKIRFHGFKGQYVLSAGLDSTLRAFSIFSERLNRNFGIASYNRKVSKKKGIRKDTHKMKPIVDFTAETTREKEWDGIAACHRRLNLVTTWSFNRCKMGAHKLIHNRFDGQYNVVALCVSLSFCGNYVIIGYNTGHIDRYNIQSGIHRAQYGNKAHDGAVRGVVSDSLNQFVISGGNDFQLKFWRFNGKGIFKSITMDSPIAQLVLHKDSSLLAVSLDNFYVNIVDCETRRVIRVFGAHGNRVTDMAFNNECRWLITASMDSVIRVWDLPLGLMVDAFRVSTPCVSLALSPTGQFLATAHSETLGVYLWSNLSLYAPITLSPLPEDFEPVLQEMPVIRSDEEEGEEGEEDNHLDNHLDMDSNDKQTDQQMDVNQDMVYKSPEQLADYLITLSSLPESKWKNLLNLDLIKKRNKPKEAVLKPQNAPFFLPTVAGLEPTFGTDWKESEKQMDLIDSHLINKLKPISSFGQLLVLCNKQLNYCPLIERLKELGQSAIDAEIRSLSPNLMIHFLDAMEEWLKTNKDFQLIESFLGLFLKIHIEDIVSNEELKTRCDRLSQMTDQLWDRLSKEFNKSLCLTNYLRSAVL